METNGIFMEKFNFQQDKPKIYSVHNWLYIPFRKIAFIIKVISLKFVN